MDKKTTQRRKGGTHGSVAKAGKIRHHTGMGEHQRKFREELVGARIKKYDNKRKSPSPIRKNRRNYKLRILYGR